MFFQEAFRKIFESGEMSGVGSRRDEGGDDRADKRQEHVKLAREPLA